MKHHNFVREEEFYAGLDKGIRFVVRVLHAYGIDTCQSCEGGEGHSYDRPTVEMVAGPSDAVGFAAVSCLQSYGLPLEAVALLWPLYNGLPYEKLWQITFQDHPRARSQMNDRADEQTMFVYEYLARQVPGG